MIAEKLEIYEEIPDGLVDLSGFVDENENETAEKASNYYNTKYLELATTKVPYTTKSKLEVMQDSFRKGTTIQSVLATHDNIAQALEYIKTIHADAQGYITLAQKIGGNWCQYHFTVTDLKKCLNNATVNADMGISTLGIDLAKDTYISMNTYYVPKGTLACIKQIRACYMEFDNHSDDFVMTDDIYNSCKYFLQQDYFGSKVPYPSLMVKTGRGIQLIWTLENLPKSGDFLWQKVSDAIREELQDFNYYGLAVDNAACSLKQVFRLPGTKHTKTGITTLLDKEMSTKTTYRLDGLIEGYFPNLKEEELQRKAELVEIQKEIEKRKSRKAKNLVKKPKKEIKATVKNYYTLNFARVSDFEKLFELRQGDFKENRNNFMYIYTYYLYLIHKNDMIVIDKVSRLNSRFSQNCGGPLEDDKIAYILTYYKEKAAELVNAENKKDDKITAYRFKNSTLINIFEITQKEQKEMKTIISKSEKEERHRKIAREYRRKNYVKQTNKKEELLIKYNKIKGLKLTGYKNKEIALELNIPVKTLERYITKMKKEGIL